MYVQALVHMLITWKSYILVVPNAILSNVPRCCCTFACWEMGYCFVECEILSFILGLRFVFIQCVIHFWKVILILRFFVRGGRVGGFLYTSLLIYVEVSPCALKDLCRFSALSFFELFAYKCVILCIMTGSTCT